MNIAIWLARQGVKKHAGGAVFHGTDAVLSYAEWATRCAELAGALRDTGVAPGDRVALFSANRWEYLVAMWGIWWAGAVAVPINAKLHPQEAAFILADSGAKLTIADHRGSNLPGDVWNIGNLPASHGLTVTDRASETLAWLFYTSGTTGQPKGVQITHGMLAATSLSYPIDVDVVSAEDAALYAAPMSHGAGIYAPIHVAMAARHVVPASGGYDAVEVLELAAETGAVSMFLAPTMVRRLLDAAKASRSKGAGIKTIVYGGGPMYLADIKEAVDWFGPKFVQIYGQGECPMAITALSRDEVADRSHPDWEARLGSVGRVQTVVQVRVDAAPGAAGEICVRGAPVMPGYWNNPVATAHALQDGWLHTGDVGRMSSDGYLTLVDRSKDLIISGGSNIYPREVEEVLLQHANVREVSVIGVASQDWGEDVLAVVVGDVAPEDLDAWCLDRIARFKRPKRYVFVEDLPKNAYGKVLKTELRQRFA